MGAWGYENFANDLALDYLAEYVKRGPVVIREMLQEIIQVGKERVYSADDVIVSAAMCEIVAACHGKPSQYESKSSISDSLKHREKVIKNKKILDYAVEIMNDMTEKLIFGEEAIYIEDLHQRINNIYQEKYGSSKSQ